MPTHHWHRIQIKKLAIDWSALDSTIHLAHVYIPSTSDNSYSSHVLQRKQELQSFGYRFGRILKRFKVIPQVNLTHWRAHSPQTRHAVLLLWLPAFLTLSFTLFTHCFWMQRTYWFWVSVFDLQKYFFQNISRFSIPIFDKSSWIL